MPDLAAAAAVAVNDFQFVQFGTPERGAIFGPRGLEDPYRYCLWGRVSASERVVAFVLLNPSKATHEMDDPTMVKCFGYGERWGFGVVVLVNAFAWRATDPKELKAAVMHGADPVGPANDFVLRTVVQVTPRPEFIVCGWGQHARLETRSGEMRSWQMRKVLKAAGADTRVLKLAKNGEPYHPLYLKNELGPRRWPL